MKRNCVWPWKFFSVQLSPATCLELRLGVAERIKFLAVIAVGFHPFPSRTRQLSPPAPMVVGPQGPSRVGRRQIIRPKSPPISDDRAGSSRLRRYSRRSTCPDLLGGRSKQGFSARFVVKCSGQVVDAVQR